MSGPWRAHEDEPVVRQPELAELVELASNQRVPTLRTSATMLSALVDDHVRARRRTWLVGATLAAVAAALLVAIGPRVLQERADEMPSTAVHEAAAPSPEGEVEIVPPQSVAPPVLPSPPVVAPNVPPPPASAVAPPPTNDAAKVVDTSPSAAELARAAERSMAAGRRDETIRILTQLVRRYPKSSPARAALFDLGRLLRASGRNDEARCAYRLLRTRWPDDAMRGEIDRVLKSLGDGPECRGLQPL